MPIDKSLIVEFIDHQMAALKTLARITPTTLDDSALKAIHQFLLDSITPEPVPPVPPVPVPPAPPEPTPTPAPEEPEQESAPIRVRAKLPAGLPQGWGSFIQILKVLVDWLASNADLLNPPKVRTAAAAAPAPAPKAIGDEECYEEECYAPMTAKDMLLEAQQMAIANLSLLVSAGAQMDYEAAFAARRHQGKNKPVV